MVLSTGVETNYARMHDFMMNPLILTVYIVGTLSCLYHLTNGIFTFCITWGITVGASAQTMVNRACVVAVRRAGDGQRLDSDRVPRTGLGE